MSNSNKRSDNRPFKLQFGGGAKEPIEDAPQLAPNLDDVDDEFVFHNSAAIMRELRAKREVAAPKPTEPTQQPTDLPQPDAAAKPAPSPTGDDVDLFDNILDPNWQPDNTREVPAPDAVTPALNADNPTPMPPMP